MSMKEPTTGPEIRADLSGVPRVTRIDLATSKNGINWSSNALSLRWTVILTVVVESGGRPLDCLRSNPNVGVKVVPAGFLRPVTTLVCGGHGRSRYRAHPAVLG